MSSKNVTLGVPRIKELINAAKKIKTPSLTMFLKNGKSKKEEFFQRTMKTIEHVMFKDIVESTEIDLENDDDGTVVEDDKELVSQFNALPNVAREMKSSAKGNGSNKKEKNIEKRQTSRYVLRYVVKAHVLRQHYVTLDEMVQKLMKTLGSGFKFEWNDEFSTPCVVRIRPYIDKNSNFMDDKALLETLHIYLFNEQEVSGVSKVQKAYFVEPSINNDECTIETDGSNLSEVLTLPYVDSTRTISNDVHEVYSILGIEAARNVLIKELVAVYNSYGIYINIRHIMLIAEVMCQSGSIMSITRHGMNTVEYGPLVKCAFEETTHVLLKAARFNKSDPLKGPTESTMVGSTPKIGTNMFEVLLDERLLEQTPKQLDVTEGDKNAVHEEYVPQFVTEVPYTSGKSATNKTFCLDFSSLRDEPYDPENPAMFEYKI